MDRKTVKNYINLLHTIYGEDLYSYIVFNCCPIQLLLNVSIKWFEYIAFAQFVITPCKYLVDIVPIYCTLYIDIFVFTPKLWIGKRLRLEFEVQEFNFLQYMFGCKTTLYLGLFSDRRYIFWYIDWFWMSRNSEHIFL